MRVPSFCITLFVAFLPITGPQVCAQIEGTTASHLVKRIEEIGEDWRKAFKLGCELAAVPGEAGWIKLREAWPMIESHTVKQQFVKAWNYEPPGPYKLRLHPHLFDLLGLALEDDPEVAEWVTPLVKTYAWLAIKDSKDARTWLAERDGASPQATIEKTMRNWVEAMKQRKSETSASDANRIAHAGHPFRRNPELMRIGRVLGIEGVLRRALEDDRLTLNAQRAAYYQLIEFDPERYTLEGLLEVERSIEAEHRRALESTVRIADGDQRKRWLLHEPSTDAAQPPNDYGLLIVMPGGTGSIDFTPFVRDTIAHAAGTDYLVAQIIAPPIETGDDNAIVWPTQGLGDDRVDFTMEPIVLAVIAELQEKHSIDEKRIFTMGWSSGGPLAYNLAMLKDSPVRGAFVTMSVFKPAQLPDPSGAAGKSFYILHSPDDFIAMSFPENAQSTLAAADARVTLKTYEGGHGWHGDSYGSIRRAVQWLEGR